MHIKAPPQYKEVTLILGGREDHLPRCFRRANCLDVHVV